MKKCLNCNSITREKDIFCRNCGCILESNKKRILKEIAMILLIVGIIFMIMLFIASYLI